jgi:hypothetical protein
VKGKKTAKWGSELPDEPPPVATPMVTASGYDLSRDLDAQIKTHPQHRPSLAEPLTTPFRRLRATEYGASAAGILAMLNLIAAVDVGHRPGHALIGHDPHVYIAAQLIAAALAGGLGLMIISRHWLWACEVVLLWSMFELVPYETTWLYGHAVHGREWFLALGALGFAMVGVRGAWALRRAARRERRRKLSEQSSASTPAP